MKDKKQTILLVLIISLAIFLRWFPVRGDLFTFEYDMAKDSLIMLEMFQYLDPSLVGATTSIPGLFNGPIWYYIALIPNIILRFHPMASITTVWILVALNIYLLKKYTNTFTAFLYAISAGVIGAQQNAWVPYITSIIMVPELLLLINLKEKKIPGNIQIFVLGLVTSLFFHFQAAFGVVIVPIIFFILYLEKIKISIKQAAIGLVGFFSTLTPLMIFELKNNFIQTKAVVSFVQNFDTQANVIEPNQQGLGRIVEIFSDMLKIAGQAVSPLELGFIGGVIALLILIFYVNRKENQQDIKVVIPMLAGTFLLYLVLPAKTYYLVALLPVWIFVAGKYINQNFQKHLPLIKIILLFFVGVNLQQSLSTYKLISQTQTDLYEPKEKAVETAYKLANDQPFRSYHFVPQIYDYTYQHIYLQKNLTGKYLPTEFSYAPGEFLYNTYKHIRPQNPESDIVILIVEKYVYRDVFDEWWGRVTTNLTIQAEIKITDAITVYKAKDEAF